MADNAIVSVVNTPSDEIVRRTANNSLTGINKFGDAANYTQIDAAGNIELFGTAKYIRHIQIPAMIAGNVANQPAATEVGTAAGYQFASSGAQEELHFQWEVPDDWDGSTIFVEIDWLPDSGAMTNPDAIKWTFEYYSVAEGELINSGVMATKSVIHNTTTPQYKIVHSRVYLDDANQPLTKQDHIFFRCLRDTTVGNGFWWDCRRNSV